MPGSLTSIQLGPVENHQKNMVENHRLENHRVEYHHQIYGLFYHEYGLFYHKVHENGHGMNATHIFTSFASILRHLGKKSAKAVNIRFHHSYILHTLCVFLSHLVESGVVLSHLEAQHEQVVDSHFHFTGIIVFLANVT